MTQNDQKGCGTGHAGADDEWVAWGHGNTKTRTGGGRKMSRSSHSSLQGTSTGDEEWVAWGHGSTSTHTSHSKHGSHHGRKRRHTGRNVATIIIFVVVVLLIGGTGYLAYSAYGAYEDAQEIMDQIDILQESLSSGDAQAMQESAAVIQQDATSMKKAVSNPVWAVAAVLPVIGTDISNVRTMGTVVEDLATNALTPLAQQADSFSLGPLVEDGAFNVEMIAELADTVTEISPVVQRSAGTVDEIEEGSIGQVNDIIDKVCEQLDGFDALCQGLGELAPYLTDIMGADGSRTYLILAHNLAEIRSGGGFIGSVGTLTIEDGKMELGEFGSFWDVRDSSLQDSIITDEEAELFSGTYGVTPGNNSENPDFSREAELSQAMWGNAYGEEIDGAIAVDSQVLADFLALTGGVTASNGVEVAGDNAVQVLEHDTYWDYFSTENYTSDSATESDEYFAEVAELAFDSVLDNIGTVSLTGLADAIGRNAEESRLLVWFDDEDEEQAVVNLGASGTISTDEATAELGVYIQAAAAYKMDWYQTSETTCSLISRNNDGSKTYTVTSTFSNTATEEEVEQATVYLVGHYDGTIKDNIYLYAPAGGSISDVSVSGGEVKGDYEVDGHSVCKVHLEIDPGSTATITYQVTTGASATEELTLRTTPLAQGNE